MKILKVLSAVALCTCFSAQAAFLNFNDYTIDSYGGAPQAGVGTSSVSADGSTLKLEGNIWSSITDSFTISASTILYFDFMSTSEGEIHGVAFDTNTSLNENKTYQLFGSQNWGVLTFDNYSLGDGWKTYSINVGTLYSGNFSKLAFAMDDDAPVGPTANSFFRNIQICDGCERMVATAVSAPATGSILALGMLLLAIRRFIKS